MLTVLAAASVTSACVDDIPAATPAPFAERDESVVAELIAPSECGTTPDNWGAMVIEQVAKAYRNAPGAWPGFDPNEIPAVVFYRYPSHDISTDIIGINLPSPESLGNSHPISSNGTPFISLHCVTSLQNPVRSRLETAPWAARDFGLPGHTEPEIRPMVMMAQFDFQDFDPRYTSYATRFIRELFIAHRARYWEFQGSYRINYHRIQVDEVMVELMALEDRALRDAVLATDLESRTEIARLVAAIRSEYLHPIWGLRHIEGHELLFGVPTYVEHWVAAQMGDDSLTAYFGNFRIGSVGRLASNIWDIEEILEAPFRKPAFYVGLRAYATGAALMYLLNEIECPYFHGRMQRWGYGPGETLIECFTWSHSLSEVPALVAEARERYDPDGELAEMAREVVAAIPPDTVAVVGRD